MQTAGALVQIYAAGNESSAPNKVSGLGIAIKTIKAIQDPQVSRRTMKETLKLSV
jgi:hypothetical protein